ncbi:apolipoprotein N-acyltransferase [Helicobacter sp.]|uniref:apolipoprotein N-acyltransferase n=1 Tax=Helicobacter sp. TaxID=218 RepID=UPI00198B34EB|nr:apolipoprotein N-acyltransferase [Helicobacter sp.]MBD5164351.1 apolipoprotein N-acyltransferase [Helicobacter sp.]
MRANPKLYASLLGALCALCFSAFIYLEHFLRDSNVPIFSSLCALFGIFLYFRLSRLGAFICGAWIGILWFYWVGFSFRFYDIAFLIPLVWIVFSLVYGGLFYLFCFFKNPIYRIATLTLSSFVHPFGFNWLILESMLTKSYFFPSKFIFFLLLMSVLIFSLMLDKKLYKTSGIWLMLFCSLLILPNQTGHSNPAKVESQDTSKLKIKTLSLDIPQNLRWDSAHLNQIITQNYQQIAEARAQKYDLVILPETAFPLALNLYPSLIESLKIASQEIAILTGGIYQDDQHIFNSAYLFYNGEMQVFHKLILVPFGEKIPLPRFLAKWINQIIFEGTSDFDFEEFKKPNSALIGKEPFSIAICYEATREEFYQDSPKNLIAISNNAWFSPSIEPTLQKLLMLYFAKNYGTTIYHSSNASEDFTLEP